MTISLSVGGGHAHCLSVTDIVTDSDTVSDSNSVTVTVTE